MAWHIVAVAAVSFISNTQKAKAEAEALAADRRLQRERLRIMRERQQESYQKNQAALDRTEAANAIAIEKASLKAQSDLKVATGGSGVSGITLGEMSSEVLNDVAEAHNENIRQARATEDAMFSQQQDILEDMQLNVDNLGAFDANAATQTAALGALGAGLQTGISSGTFDEGFNGFGGIPESNRGREARLKKQKEAK